MSQTHTHGPGQPAHSHGPAPPQQLPPGAAQQQQQAQKAAMPQPDPVMQAIIEASFVPVDIALSTDNVAAQCEKHALEKCATCDVDFVSLNRLSRLLQMNPGLRCPPPPTLVSQKLSAAINNTKEEGNTLYKAGRHDMALQRYTMAANFAIQRPSWEAAQMMREELSAVLSNRSASFFEMGDWINALLDANQVVQLKRQWGKGHYRKARTLLKMEQYEEAKEAIELGLEFEPESAEMSALRDSIAAKLQGP